MRSPHACLGLLVVLLAGCGGGSSAPSAPSDLEGVSIEGETLVSVSDRICHVRGTIVNATPDVTVDVTMRWHALDQNDQEIGTTKLKVSRVGPSTRQDFESSGFASNGRGLIGCPEISRFERIETAIAPR